MYPECFERVCVCVCDMNTCIGVGEDMWVLRVPPIIVFRNDINIIIIIIFPCWHYYCVAVWKWKEMSGILDNGEAVEMGQRYQISTFVLCYACWIQFHSSRMDFIHALLAQPQKRNFALPIWPYDSRHWRFIFLLGALRRRAAYT